MERSGVLFGLVLSFLSGAAFSQSIMEKSLASAFVEGRQYTTPSRTNAVAKVISGLVLNDGQIGKPIMLALVSPLETSQGGKVFTGGQCFLIANFAGFKDSMPGFNVIRASCIDNAGSLYEQEAGPGETLGSAYYGPGSLRPVLSVDKGGRGLESGTNLSIRFERF